MKNTISIQQALSFLNKGLSLNNELLLIEELDATCFPKGIKKIKCFLFILCTNGSLTCEIDHKSYHLKKNDILLLFNQNTITSNFQPSKYFSGTALMVDFTYFQNIIGCQENIHDIAREVAKSQSFTMSESSVTEITSYLEVIKNELLQNYSNKRPNSFNLVIIFVKHIFEKRPSYNYTEKSHYLTSYYQKESERFVNLVKKHLKEEHHTNFYCNLMQTTYSRLNKITKNTLYLTPQQAINQILIKEICQSITNNAPTKLKEIAALYHFQSETTFCRFFKRETKKSPNQFRYEQAHLQPRKAHHTTLAQTSLQAGLPRTYKQEDSTPLLS